MNRVKSWIRTSARALGYELTRIRDPFLRTPPEVASRLRALAPYTMLPQIRLASLFAQAVHCERQQVRGCFVECGVWKGGAVATMALANLTAGTERRPIHLFDSFQEICEPDPRVDGERALEEARGFHIGELAGRLQPLKGIYDSIGGPGTLEGNRCLLVEEVGYPEEQLHFHPGWFQDRLPTDSRSLGPIALLRIDADWHSSTKVCLEHLYPKVVQGGFVIIDDYGAYDGCRQAVEEYIRSNAIDAYLIHLDDCCSYWRKMEGSP